MNYEEKGDVKIEEEHILNHLSPIFLLLNCLLT